MQARTRFSIWGPEQDNSGSLSVLYHRHDSNGLLCRYGPINSDFATLPLSMPHPIIVIASFLTTIKTTWELSRMVRQRRAAQILKTEVPRIYRALRQAHGKGLLVGREFDYLLERLICAEASKDSMLCLSSLT